MMTIKATSVTLNFPQPDVAVLRFYNKDTDTYVGEPVRVKASERAHVERLMFEMINPKAQLAQA